MLLRAFPVGACVQSQGLVEIAALSLSLAPDSATASKPTPPLAQALLGIIQGSIMQSAPKEVPFAFPRTCPMRFASDGSNMLAAEHSWLWIAFTGRYRADHRPFVAFSPRTRLQPLRRSRTAKKVPESEIAYAWLPIDASLFQAFLSASMLPYHHGSASHHLACCRHLSSPR